MSKILITGSRGFLGNHVLNQLYNSNLTIIAPSSKELNLLNRSQLDQFMYEEKPEIVLHMAAVCGGLLANKNSPAEFLTANTQMGLNVYESAVKYNHKIERIYSLGSICMFPKYCPIPFKEDDLWNGMPEETNFPYGQAKRTLLLLSQTYRQQFGIKGGHLIPVNMYGPEDSFDSVNSHVIPALIKKFIAAKENNLPEVLLWGTGNASREFLYVKDCATAISKAVSSGFDSPLPVNLGTGQEITIKDLASTIKQLTSYSGEIVFTNEVGDGQPRRCLDVQRAKDLLDWSADTSLKEGLIKTIEWYTQNKGSL